MGKRKAGKQCVNQELCDMLNEIAEYEQSIKKNVAKYNVYKNAAKVVFDYTKKITSGKEALELNGINEKIAGKIDEFLQTGKVPKVEQMKEDGSYDAIKLLMKVWGIGPAEAQEFASKGVRTLDDLRRMRRKLTVNQKIGLKYFNDFQQKIPRTEMNKIKTLLFAEISEMDEQYIATLCGSYRRGKHAVGDIKLLLSHPDYKSTEEDSSKVFQGNMKDIVESLMNSGFIVDSISLDDSKFKGVCQLMEKKPVRRFDMKLTPYDQYYCHLLHFTGPETYIIRMQEHALQKGYTLTKDSIRKNNDNGEPGDPIEVNSEKDIFNIIDFPYQSPERRK